MTTTNSILTPTLCASASSTSAALVAASVRTALQSPLDQFGLSDDDRATVVAHNMTKPTSALVSQVMDTMREEYASRMRSHKITVRYSVAATEEQLNTVAREYTSIKLEPARRLTDHTHPIWPLVNAINFERLRAMAGNVPLLAIGDSAARFIRRGIADFHCCSKTESSEDYARWKKSETECIELYRQMVDGTRRVSPGVYDAAKAIGSIPLRDNHPGRKQYAQRYRCCRAAEDCKYQCSVGIALDSVYDIDTALWPKIFANHGLEVVYGTMMNFYDALSIPSMHKKDIGVHYTVDPLADTITYNFDGRDASKAYVHRYSNVMKYLMPQEFYADGVRLCYKPLSATKFGITFSITRVDDIVYAPMPTSRFMKVRQSEAMLLHSYDLAEHGLHDEDSLKMCDIVVPVSLYQGVMDYALSRGEDLDPKELRKYTRSYNTYIVINGTSLFVDDKLCSKKLRPFIVYVMMHCFRTHMLCGSVVKLAVDRIKWQRDTYSFPGVFMRALKHSGAQLWRSMFGGSASMASISEVFNRYYATSGDGQRITPLPSAEKLFTCTRVSTGQGFVAYVSQLMRGRSAVLSTAQDLAKKASEGFYKSESDEALAMMPITTEVMSAIEHYLGDEATEQQLRDVQAVTEVISTSSGDLTRASQPLSDGTAVEQDMALLTTPVPCSDVVTQALSVCAGADNYTYRRGLAQLRVSKLPSDKLKYDKCQRVAYAIDEYKRYNAYCHVQTVRRAHLECGATYDKKTKKPNYGLCERQRDGKIDPSYLIMRDGVVVGQKPDYKREYMVAMDPDTRVIHKLCRDKHSGEITAPTNSSVLFVMKAFEVFTAGALASAVDTHDLQSLCDAVSHCKFIMKQGVAGCGKTESILRLYKVGDLILTSTHDAAKDMRARGVKKGCFSESDSEKIVRTVDSWIMHGGVPANRVFTDESLMQHSGAIYFSAYQAACTEMHLYGDRTQIPFCDFSDGFTLQCAEMDLLDSTHYKNQTYRLNAPTVAAVAGFYKDVHEIYTVRNDHMEDLQLHKIRTINDVPKDPKYTYLAWTNADVDSLRKYLGDGFVVKTVHKAQGHDLDNACLVNLHPYPIGLMKQPRWANVALTRHKYKFVYYTRCVIDAATDLVVAGIHASKRAKSKWHSYVQPAKDYPGF